MALEALSQLASTLSAHQANCEAAGRYAEAEIARRRLAELTSHGDARRREALTARQLAARLAVEEAHGTEFTAFGVHWDQRMSAADDAAIGLLAAARERHAGELRDLQQRMLASVGAPRHSRAYIDLRHAQHTLAQQKRYEAAAALKAKADELLASETEAWTQEKEREMLRKEDIFKTRLAAEAEALRARITTKRGELNRARHRALEGLLQRYANVKATLAKEHAMQAGVLDAGLQRETLARRAEESLQFGSRSRVRA